MDASLPLNTLSFQCNHVAQSTASMRISSYHLQLLLQIDSQNDDSEVESTLELVCHSHMDRAKGHSKKRSAQSSSAPEPRSHSAEDSGYNRLWNTRVIDLFWRRNRPSNRTLSGTFCRHRNLQALLIEWFSSHCPSHSLLYAPRSENGALIHSQLSHTPFCGLLYTMNSSIL